MSTIANYKNDRKGRLAYDYRTVDGVWEVGGIAWGKKWHKIHDGENVSWINDIREAIKRGHLTPIPPARRVYIAGPMRGYPKLNFPAFDEAANRARAKGFDVVSPAEMDREEGIDPEHFDESTFDIIEALERDMAALLECHAVAALPGWERSKGATAEVAVALCAGLEILDARTFEPLKLASPEPAPAPVVGTFTTKDSGKRESFAGGMVRDTQEGKTRYHLPLDGPMFGRWAELLTRGAVKYSERNWMKADGPDELDRFKASAVRHFVQWWHGETDEDHAAAVFFNINGTEYVKGRGALAKASLN